MATTDRCCHGNLRPACRLCLAASASGYDPLRQSFAPPAPLAFNVGQHVRKVTGDYSVEGVIVAAFRKRNGVARYVLECSHPEGLLLIFAAANLEVIP